jgi:ribosomal protein S27E
VQLPKFVVKAVAKYLDCGQLSKGFIRVRCGGCGDDRLVAFSRKVRGLCPSCDGRRMADEGVQLVDHVLPEVPPPAPNPGPVRRACPGTS